MTIVLPKSLKHSLPPDYSFNFLSCVHCTSQFLRNVELNNLEIKHLVLNDCANIWYKYNFYIYNILRTLHILKYDQKFYGITDRITVYLHDFKQTPMHWTPHIFDVINNNYYYLISSGNSSQHFTRYIFDLINENNNNNSKNGNNSHNKI